MIKMKNLKSSLTIVVSSFVLVTMAEARSVAFSDEAICKATMSLVMNQKPTIIKARNVGNEVVVSYKRANDGKTFEYKCLIKQSENKVIWAAKLDNAWGRWRDGQYDAVITYKVENMNLIVDEAGHSKKFKASELGH